MNHKARKHNTLPPRGFRSADSVDWARFSSTAPPFIRNTRVKGSRGEGIRYEKKVHEHFLNLYGSFYVPSPWIEFGEGDSRPRWCQPDALLFRPYTGQITLIECKLQHTSDAWWQTKWLYLPVLRKMFPSTLWKFACCEVVKWFDPATHFPERIQMQPSPADAHPGEFSVHIWKP